MAILSKAFSKGNKVVASLLAGAAMVGAGAATPPEAVAETIIKLSDPIVWSTTAYDGEIDSQAGIATVTGVSSNSPFFDPSYYLEPDPTQAGSFELLMGGAFAKGAWGNYGTGAQSYASTNREAYATATINSGINWDTGLVYGVKLLPYTGFNYEVVVTQRADHNCTVSSNCSALSVAIMGVFSATGNELVFTSQEASSWVEDGVVINSTGDMSTLNAYNGTDTNQIVYIVLNSGTQAIVPVNAVSDGSAIAQLGDLPSFTSPVPEPGNGALLALGLLTVGLMNGFRNRSQPTLGMSV